MLHNIRTKSLGCNIKTETKPSVSNIMSKPKSKQLDLLLMYLIRILTIFQLYELGRGKVGKGKRGVLEAEAGVH